MKACLKKLFLFGMLALCFARLDATPHRAAATDAIRIGVFLPLSGPTASFGLDTMNGVNLAVEEINKAGGINGRQIQILSEDDQGRPENAATLVTKLIDEDRVVALLGDVASGNSMAAAPIAQARKVPMISPASTHPAVTAFGNYIFRATFSDPFQGELAAEFAVKNLKAKRVAILFDGNSGYSRSLVEAFEKKLNQLGVTVMVKQSYTAGDRDFKGQLVAIKSRKPDVIFVPGYYTEAAMIAKQARQLAIKTPLLGGDGWDSQQLFDLGGAALDGSYIVHHYASDEPSPANKEFVASYKARYEGLAPNVLAALGYDAMKLLADAIRRAGTTESPALRAALAGTKNFAAVTGPLSIDQNREVIKPAVVLKVQDGKFVYHATIQPAASPDKSEKIYEPEEVDQRARILKKSEPQYTEEARRKRTSGWVVLRVVLKASGEIGDIKVIRDAPDGLTAECIKVAREIKFEPALKDGNRVSQYLKVEYTFATY